MLSGRLTFDMKIPTLKAFCLLFVISQPIFALPITLEAGWSLAKGWDNSEGIPDISLTKLKENIAKLSLDKETLQKITLKKEIELSSEDLTQANRDSFALHFPFVSNVFRIYWNDKLVLSEGEVSSDDITKSGYTRHIIIKLDRDLVNLGKNQIKIEIGASPGEELSLYASMNDEAIRLDTFANLDKINKDYLTYMLIFLYFFVGLYHALFYIKRPQEQYNGYYALFSIFLSVYLFFRSQAVYILDLDPYFITRFEYFTVFLTPLWLLLFMEKFFRGSFGRGTIAYSLFTACLAFGQFFVSRSLSLKVLMLWQISVLFFTGYATYVMIKAIRSKNPDAYRMVLGFLIVTVTGVWDVLGATGLLPIQNLNLLRYGFLFFVLGIAVILANRFLRVHNEVENLNANLEKRVEERTNELQETLQKVQELKVQQDGDYFLTSLLLDPLGKLQQNSEFLYCESYTKQKKEFEFRSRVKEIGGDIIITDRIELGGQKFSVFINGDAMGKSMQGAGGALVLGVVFQSVIKRTHLKAENRNRTPERWIKECFIELQAIFESFQGSMLVSVVMGLIEEDSGLIYYLNAEHPWTVLYRDGKASFIEDQLELRKIGTTGLEGDIRIRVYQLEKGDVMIIGSDGRDDLIIGIDKDGKRIINEDESQFLRRVEEADGNLKSLVSGLQKFGSLSDDLTLLRMEWKGDKPKINRSEFSEWKEGIDLFKEKKYAEALTKLEVVFKQFPLENEILFLLSYCYKRTKSIQKAIDFGEKLRLRDPLHIQNLVHLGYCFRMIGAREKAVKIYEKAKHLSPEHSQVKKLGKSLEHSKQLH